MISIDQSETAVLTILGWVRAKRATTWESPCGVTQHFSTRQDVGLRRKQRLTQPTDLDTSKDF